MLGESKFPIELSGVPETLLWNLYHRAIEAEHPHTVLPDPKAIELVGAIDYPFDDRFGGDNVATLAQAQGLRSRRFDDEINAFLEAHPSGTVVALGEGLETQFWRVDNEQVTWISVDLPEVVDIREQLLPLGDRQFTLSRSVLDEAWMDQIDPKADLLFTAQGLFMYLRPTDVYRLMRTLAKRFPGSTLLFDTVPQWYSSRTIRGQVTTDRGYQVPEMPWGLGKEERHILKTTIPGVAEIKELQLARGRGFLLGELIPALSEIPAVRARLPFPAPIVMRFTKPARLTRGPVG